MTPPSSYELSASQARVSTAAKHLDRKSRLAVVGPAGSGKGLAIAWSLANRLSEPNDFVQRILVIAGRSILADQWAWAFHEMGEEALIVGPTGFRRLQLHTPKAANPWDTAEAPVVVTYIDFVKSPERLQRLLDAHWDVVVLDEIPDARADSLRHSALMDIWNSDRSFVRILATWKSEHSVLADATDVMRVEIGGDLSISMATEIRVRHTPAAAAVLTDIRARLSRFPPTFAHIMLRRASSSVYALEQSLSLLALRTPEGLRHLGIPDGEGPRQPAHTPDGQEIDAVFNLIQHLEVDDKWEAALSQTRRISDPGLVAVFTDYADTADYLTYLFESQGVSVATITGRTAPNERARIIDKAYEGKLVLVVSHPIWIQDLPVAAIIHYDRPAGADVLVERIRSVARRLVDFEHYVIVDPILDIQQSNDREQRPESRHDA